MGIEMTQVWDLGVGQTCAMRLQMFPKLNTPTAGSTDSKQRKIYLHHGDFNVSLSGGKRVDTLIS